MRLLSFLCLFWIGFNQLNAYPLEFETINIEKQNKYYLDSDSIYILDKEIFINVEGNFFSVDNIEVDAFGIFSLVTEGQEMHCPKCGRTWFWGWHATQCPHGKVH